MSGVVSIDNQPISATFFGEGKWLTEFVTPNAMEVQELARELGSSGDSKEGFLRSCRDWVASNIRYKPFIKAKIWVEGKTSVNKDTWLPPSITKLAGVGNCANKSFLLASLLRNRLDPGDVHVVLGNLYNGKPGGHAWVQVNLDERAYIMESTRPDVESLIRASVADRYEPVHFFNDQTAWAIEGRTVMEPFSNAYSTWLKDYLDWAYIEGKK